eukprot:4220956-Pyramimonas_sp.AAC.1
MKHNTIQQTRRTLGHPPRADLDHMPRSDGVPEDRDSFSEGPGPPEKPCRLLRSPSPSHLSPSPAAELIHLA